MTQPLLIALLVLVALVIVLQIIALRRQQPATPEQPEDTITPALDRLERELAKLPIAYREEAAHSRKESADLAAQARDEHTRTAKSQREELSAKFDAFSLQVKNNVADLGTHQQRSLKEFADRLEKLTTTTEQKSDAFRESVEKKMDQVQNANTQHREEQVKASKSQREELSAKFDAFGLQVKNNITDLGTHQQRSLKEFAERLEKLNTTTEQKADALRLAIEKKLDQLQQSNEEKLEKMRQTVDEKLHKTLESRLGESFKIVSERLEKVHRGLGEMQELATGVGDLKRVMTNVKTRGTWGEVLLGNLLEQVLTAEQYEANCKVKPRSEERVEYAVKLPGPEEDAGSCVYLPIDAKFPKETYERIVAAAENADVAALEQASKELEQLVMGFARDIRDKYIAPPHTTDFAILFVPTEGLYAELVRRPGLVEKLQRDCRVNLAGPTTLLALLNALQMGFRTLAIQKRSGEVWKLLGGVKTEFARFEDWIAAVQKKLHSASKEMDKAAVRTKQIHRKLAKVQELPTGDVTTPLVTLLADEVGGGDDEAGESGDDESGDGGVRAR